MTFELVKAVFQILFIASFLYYFYISLAQNMAFNMVKQILGFIIMYLVSVILHLDVLETALKAMVLPSVVFFCILYQPELRRAFAIGLTTKGRFFGRRGAQTTADSIDMVIGACQRLVQVRRGALFVFPRQVSIKNIIETGTKINADITSSLIVTVFDHDTPLHDGAMVIQGEKIIAAGCYLPLSAQTNIQQSFGTRHRAGLGMAEESDAVVIIVSEETGAISLAFNGKLYYDLSAESAKAIVFSLLNNLEIEEDLTSRENNEN